MNVSDKLQNVDSQHICKIFTENELTMALLHFFMITFRYSQHLWL